MGRLENGVVSRLVRWFVRESVAVAVHGRHSADALKSITHNAKWGHLDYGWL
jgi:hypothetical protein